jgi:prophage maintenance system killer protein
MSNQIDKGEIVIYRQENGTTEISVHMKDNSLWLNQYQLAELFETDRTSIIKHIKNIYHTEELSEDGTCAKIAQVQNEGGRNITRKVLNYNLDMIISVGYRVNSKRGTQFRIWANNILKEHLTKGYTINERQFKEQTDRIELLKSSLSIIERSIKNQVENLDQAKSLVTLLSDFSNGLSILDDYDYKKLDTDGKTTRNAIPITINECINIINQLRKQFESSLFGKYKDANFESSINQSFQSFAGQDLYPSIEEKAAMLLYLIVKNHSFTDGNKRIAAAIFLHFLNKNNLLYNSEGKPKLSNEGLAAITLFIAESKSDEMETVKRVVISMLNRGLV